MQSSELSQSQVWSKQMWYDWRCVVYNGTQSKHIIIMVILIIRNIAMWIMHYVVENTHEC